MTEREGIIIPRWVLGLLIADYIAGGCVCQHCDTDKPYQPHKPECPMEYILNLVGGG